MSLLRPQPFPPGRRHGPRPYHARSALSDAPTATTMILRRPDASRDNDGVVTFERRSGVRGCKEGAIDVIRPSE